MPEFEARRTSVPPFSPPARRRDDVSDDDAARGDGGPQREGLPPGFRMRHDAHYVDQLTSRGAAMPHVRSIPIRDIDAPRGSDAGDLDALVRSIAMHGVLQPLLVRPRGGRFDLIAGMRRLRGATLAGLAEVPCLVHVCDEVRARALVEAERLRAPDAGAKPRTPDLAAAGLRELRQSFSGIASCLHLLVDRDAPLRDRVALDLIRTEAHRAHRLVQSLHLLTDAPPPSLAEVSLRALLDQSLDAFGPERRLSATQITVDAAEGAHTVAGDPEWLLTAVTGALGAVLSLVQSARAPALQIRLAGVETGPSVTLELQQQVVTVPEWAFPRFFDAAWTDRPGGYQAAVELAAARVAVERHSGGLELLPGDRGGCRIVMVLPPRTRPSP